MGKKKPSYEELEKRVKEFEKDREDLVLFRQMIEKSLDPVFMLDEKTSQMVYVNEAAIKHFGKPANEILLSRIPDWDPNFSEDDLPELFKNLNEFKHLNIETHHIVKDGKIVPVEVTSNLIIYNNHNYAFGYIKDISERKQNEEKIKKYAKELKDLIATKDKFLSIIAHDLKNPLNAVIGYLELFVRDVQEGNFESIKENLHIVDSSAKKVYELLESLLEWARAQSGKIAFAPEKLSLKEASVKVIENLRLHADGKNIELIDLVDDITVFADPYMLRTILRNLISNAIKFTHTEGKVEIKTKQNKKGVQITISDTGIGIAQDDIKKLFDISTEYSTIGTQNERGSGLGLLLCKEFIEKHKGTIKVDSKLGKGTTIRIFIPQEHN